MNHALSTHLFANHRLTAALLEKIQHAGVPLVELFCARQHLDWRNKAQVAELGHWFRDSELKLHSVHSPMYTDDVGGRSGPHSVLTLTEPVKSKRQTMVEEIKRVLEIAEIVPFRYLIQHIGVGEEEYDDRKIDAAFTALEELKLFGRQRGVDILLENIPNALSSAERLIYFLGVTHLNLGFCFDTGHAHMNEGVEPAFELMKDRIRSTHVHDNDGKSDTHLFPMMGNAGTIQWGNVMDCLRTRESQYPLLLELKENADVPNPLEAAVQVFDKLEKQRRHES